MDIDGMTPIDADNPDTKLWGYAPWYKGEFETPEGRQWLAAHAREQVRRRHRRHPAARRS